MRIESLRPSHLALLRAAFLRDLRIARSYKLAFLLRLLGTIFQVVVFYFISRLMAVSNATLGESYFDFVLIGLAFQRLFSLSLTGYARAISEAQQTGTLEAQALLPVSLPVLVIGSNLWPYLYATAETILYLALGVILGASLTGANLLAAVIIAILASAAISGLGFLGAALILLYKRGNAVAWVVEAATALFAGVYFPPDILPEPLQKLSFLLPQTYALAGLRATLLDGAGLSELWQSIAILLGFTWLLLPAGIGALLLAYRQAQVRGSLAQY